MSPNQTTRPGARSAASTAELAPQLVTLTPSAAAARALPDRVAPSSSKTPLTVGLVGLLVAITIAAFVLMGGTDEVVDEPEAVTAAPVALNNNAAAEAAPVAEDSTTTAAATATSDSAGSDQTVTDTVTADTEITNTVNAAAATGDAVTADAGTSETAPGETGSISTDGDSSDSEADAAVQADDLPPLSSLPERGAIFRPPTLFLEGPVQTQAIADDLYAAAAAVVGPENVVNNYVIRADAPDTTDGNVRVEQAILFGVASSEVNQAFVPVLELAVQVMSLNPQVQLIVEGHTDSIGSQAGNLELSQIRAESVVDYLIGRGVSLDRVQAVGFGASVPVADNSTEEGRQSNRRIEFELLDLLQAG